MRRGRRRDAGLTDALAVIDVDELVPGPASMRKDAMCVQICASLGYPVKGDGT